MLEEKKLKWYKNCVSNRKRKAKICDGCPFRKSVEEGEKKIMAKIKKERGNKK